MVRKVIYWISTILVAALGALAGVLYLSGGSQVVEGFAHVGYPQQLRILLGIAKPLGALALVIPGFPKLKEWAYAGFTFAWIAAHVAHHIAKDASQYLPLILLVILAISYFTRPESRKCQSAPAAE